MRNRALLIISFSAFALTVFAPFGGAAQASSTQVPGANSTADTGSTGSDAQVVLSGRVDVPRGSRSGEIVIFHGPVRIDGEVEGDVVAFDGSVLVTGLVNGDVVALDGAILVAKTGRITGDAVSRETATVASGGQVEGEVRGTGTYIGSVRVVGRIVWWFPMTISTLILGLLMLLFFPGAADAIDDAFRDRWVVSTAWGVAMIVALPAAAVLITLTLFGIPLGVGLLLALFLVLAAAYTWAAWLVGGFILPSRRILAFLVGLLILRLLALIPVLGGIVATLATIVGLGAASVAVWRARAVAGTPRGFSKRGADQPAAAATPTTPAGPTPPAGSTSPGTPT